MEDKHRTCTSGAGWQGGKAKGCQKDTGLVNIAKLGRTWKTPRAVNVRDRAELALDARTDVDVDVVIPNHEEIN